MGSKTAQIATQALPLDQITLPGLQFSIFLKNTTTLISKAAEQVKTQQMQEPLSRQTLKNRNVKATWGRGESGDSREHQNRGAPARTWLPIPRPGTRGAVHALRADPARTQLRRRRAEAASEKRGSRFPFQSPETQDTACQNLVAAAARAYSLNFV